MPGAVEREDAKVLGYLLIVQEMPELPSVGASRMAANQRNSLPCLFKINSAVVAHDPNRGVPAYNGLSLNHFAPAFRGTARTSFMYSPGAEG